MDREKSKGCVSTVHAVVGGRGQGGRERDLERKERKAVESEEEQVGGGDQEVSTRLGLGAWAVLSIPAGSRLAELAQAQDQGELAPRSAAAAPGNSAAASPRDLGLGGVPGCACLGFPRGCPVPSPRFKQLCCSLAMCDLGLVPQPNSLSFFSVTLGVVLLPKGMLRAPDTVPVCPGSGVCPLCPRGVGFANSACVEGVSGLTLGLGGSTRA